MNRIAVSAFLMRLSLSMIIFCVIHPCVVGRVGWKCTSSSGEETEAQSGKVTCRVTVAPQVDLEFEPIGFLTIGLPPTLCM